MINIVRQHYPHKPVSLQNRKPGISAVVALRNEPFVEPSLLSIKEFVDEYIVVDCSTDDTQKKVERIAHEHNLQMKYFCMMPNITKQLQTALNNSHYEWILHWAGDFIAYTSGKRDIQRLKKFIHTYPEQKFCFIEFAVFNIELDLLHTTTNPYHREAYLFKYSPSILKTSFLRKLRRYLSIKITKRLPQRSPFTHFPFWYERITLPKHHYCALHLRSVKPLLRLLERNYAIIWAILSNTIKKKFSNSFEKFFQYCIKRDFHKDINTDSKEIFQSYIEELKKNLIRYHGEYPSALKTMFNGVEIADTEDFRSTLAHILEGNN